VVKFEKEERGMNMDYTFDLTMDLSGVKGFVQVAGEDGTFFDYVYLNDMEKHIQHLRDGGYEADKADGLIPACKIRDFKHGAATYVDGSYEGGEKFYHSEYDMCAHKHGKVTYDDREFALKEQAYADNYMGGVAYFASAMDEEGNDYAVRWNTTNETDLREELVKLQYRRNQADEDGEEFDEGDAERIVEICAELSIEDYDESDDAGIYTPNDESDACDWDSPAEVKMA